MNLRMADFALQDQKNTGISISSTGKWAHQMGHQAIINVITKYCNDPNKKDWLKHLHLTLWADRITVRRSTGYLAFELVYGQDCLLPIDFSLASWSIVDWEGEVRTHEDLILARMRQLDERNLTVIKAAEQLEASQQANKDWFDTHRRLRMEDQQLSIGDLVLLHQTIGSASHTLVMKLQDRWIGPYRIIEKPPNSTFYRLAELDGTPYKDATVAGNRLKKFFKRSELNTLRQELQDRDGELPEGADVEEEEIAAVDMSRDFL